MKSPFVQTARLALAIAAVLILSLPAAAQAPNACGFFLGGGILTKWLELGAERGVLQCATGSERDASRSPQGTIDREVGALS